MTIARAAIRALPYVEGESRRFAAAPTRLTPLAGKIMLASGTLSTRRKVASFRLVRIAGPIASVAMAAMAAAYFFLGSGPAGVQTQKAEMIHSRATPFTLCIVDQTRGIAATCRQEPPAEPPDVAPAAAVVDRQDRFEIDRFIRLSSAARHEETIQHPSGGRSTGVSAR